MHLRCPQCAASAQAPALGQPYACPACQATITPLNQLEQALAQWYEPRKWRADLVEPSVPYLIERLWTANGQGETLFRGVSPKFVSYDVFCHMVTRVIARGINEGWAIIRFPEDPLAEDPVYHLEFKQPERFAGEVEALFPEVDWDEQISVRDPG
jgi:hypothetical protein